MSKVLSSTRLPGGFFLMRAEHINNARMGQFYMVRGWDHYPLLSRPLSVFDSDGETVSFLCKEVGTGTKLLADLKPGDDITLLGPLGSAIPDRDGKIALVGGGVGIAPLYLAAKELRANHPGSVIDIFLGFRDTPLLEEEYRRVSDKLTINIGGFVTDDVNPVDYDFIFTCGPDAMMRAMYNKCAAAGVPERLWVSLENRMACGIGACLVCTCKTRGGNKKACKDGPVFTGEEVYGV